MRTTLKRGIGQVGGLNGNGNGHAATPPVLGPVTRYRPEQPRRRSVLGLLLRAFGWFVLALVVIGGALAFWRHRHGHESVSAIALFFLRHGTDSALGLALIAVVGLILFASARATAPALAMLAIVVLTSGTVGGLYLYAHEVLTSVAATGAVKKAETHLAPIPSASKPAIALVAGYDKRAGIGGRSYAGSNSDTLMLLRANPINHTLSLLSFPRDLWVPIYCHGATVYTHSRINSAWSLCGSNGPAATVDTIHHLTGLNINYFITLDFHAFKQIVNHLHGVYMNVDQRYYIAPHTGTSAINLYPGYQKLDGGQALSYVRFRHFDSDVYRTGRQQLFLEALKSRLRTGLAIQDAPKLVGDLKHNVEVAKAGGGPVGLTELESYLGLAYHLPAGHLFRNSIPITDLTYPMINGASVVSAPPSAINGAVDSFLHPDIRVSQAVALPGARKVHHAKKHLLPKGQVTVLVLNGGTMPGEAGNTTYLLTKQGYATKSLPSTVPANAPKVTRDTVVYYNPVLPHAKDAAQELKPLFGSNTQVQQMTTPIADFARQAGNPLTVVAIGTSFGGKLNIAKPVKLPPRTPPQVSPGFALTVPRLRGLTPKAHFPVFAPGQVAQYAQLSNDEGVRLFKPLEHKHEVVLTFVQPDGIQHWQIEESDWTTAPILASPTAQFFYHHRKFLVYTTGGAIQMVAVRTPKAVYWVSNTILNQLSNTTMLAIAKSLRPLGR
jgi:LCP family protein required for cell wall assembly